MGLVLDEMKALSVWQPWAQLLAIGAKRFETRGWATKYRGLIAIHAAAKPTHWTVEGNYSLGTRTLRAMMDAFHMFPGDFARGMFDRLPRGAIVATAELVDVWEIIESGKTWADMRSTSDATHGYHVQNEPREIAFGDWSPGRYAWQLANVHMLDKPVPAKGLQGLWWWRRAGE